MAKAKKVVKKTTKKPITKKKKTTKTQKAKTVKKDDMMIVHNPANPTQEFIVASEWADDDAIEDELMGKAMEHYVYKFPQKGKDVTGLTVAGVNEMSRLLTRKKDSGIKIRIVPDSIKIDTNVVMDGEAGVSVTLLAENMLSGETAIGAKFEQFKKTGRNGKYDNTFPMEKAVSKAERNAKRKLIPEKVAVEMIKKFVCKESNVKQLAPVPNHFRPRAKAQPVDVDYLSKLIAMLANESDVKIDGQITKYQLGEMIETFNRYTGQTIKSLKVAQSTAQKYLMDFINSPTIIGKNN